MLAVEVSSFLRTRITIHGITQSVLCRSSRHRTQVEQAREKAEDENRTYAESILREETPKEAGGAAKERICQLRQRLSVSSRSVDESLKGKSARFSEGTDGIEKAPPRARSAELETRIQGEVMGVSLPASRRSAGQATEAH